MNSPTHKLPILLLSVFIGLTACTVTDDPAVDPETPATPSVNTAPEPDYASVATDVPVFVSASIKPEVKAAMQTFLTKVTPLEEAEVAVLVRPAAGENGRYRAARVAELHRRRAAVGKDVLEIARLADEIPAQRVYEEIDVHRQYSTKMESPLQLQYGIMLTA